MLVMPSGPVPVLVRVALCGALLWPIRVVGKVNDVGFRVGIPALTLLPLKLIPWGLPGALSVKATDPDS